MAPNELKVHRLKLRRLKVEGNLQTFVRDATLTLKDEEHDKHIMQLHVDGTTLATWDLGMLRERRLTGGEKFFTAVEHNMLQLTLPLFEEGGQKLASMKTIQLFIINDKDFQTAVGYLSKNVGMQHYDLDKVFQNLGGGRAPKLAPTSQSQDSRGTPTTGRPVGSHMGYKLGYQMTPQMTPQMGPQMGPPMRPQSQNSVHAPVRYSPSQPVFRSQTARPNLTLAAGSYSRISPTLGTTGPIRGLTPSQGNHHHWSGPLVGPPGPRSSVVPGDSSIPRRLLSAGPDAGDLGERKQLYERPIDTASMRSHMTSHPLRQDSWKFPPSSSQVDKDIGTLDGESYSDHFHGQPARHSGRILPPAIGTFSNRTYPFQELSRPSPFSDHAVPIKIHVLSLPDESKYALLHLETPWEFTLHLLPSTKMYELCLHAASYIQREYRVTVDGWALAAQKMDGTLFEDQDILSGETLQGQPIALIERSFLSTAQSAPIEPSRSGPGTSHPDRRSESGTLSGLNSASPRDTLHHALDETDRVPPPRQLPFRLAAKPAPPRSSSSNDAARSPLSERPDLINANTRPRANKRSTQPVSQNSSTEAPAKKRPKSSHKRSIGTSRRPASSASGGKFESGSATAEAPELQTLARRPETSLGIRRRKKMPLGDEGPSATMPPLTGSIRSDKEASAKEQATSSCMGCRNKHRRCDRSMPACGPCLKDKRHCIYPEVAATGHNPEKASNRPVLDTAAHPMTLSHQSLASPPMVSDALTQTMHPREYRTIGSQTQVIEQDDQDVEMRDVGTDPRNLYIDASMETDRCDDSWAPFSQCAQVVLWAADQYERRVQVAAEILMTTDPSHDDYQEKVAQAAEHAWEFEREFREKYEQALKD